MNDRVEKLKVLSSDEIDTIAEAADSHGLSEPESVSVFRESKVAAITDRFPQAIQSALPDIEGRSDFKLLRSLRAAYGVARIDPLCFSDPNFIATKINHGFWEHLAFLFTNADSRSTYRDVNLKLRQRHYLTSDFLPVLMGSFLDLMCQPQAHAFISCITGIRSVEQLFGQHWSNPHLADPDSFEVNPSRRGAIKGLLAFSELAQRTGSVSPLGVYDSFDINQSFSDLSLLNGIRGRATDKTLCLVMGPPHLSAVRIANWPGPQAFLAVSRTACMAQWAFHLANLVAVLDRVERAGQDVVVFFQGAVLGPVIADYLCSYRDRKNGNVAFVDLGRLLDLTFEHDLTSTGSPLPDGSFDSKGQLYQVEASDRIFVEN